jgi:hypothetical protein
MVPPWVPDADAPPTDPPTDPAQSGAAGEQGATPATPPRPAPPPGPLAPSGRFSSARLALGEFASTASSRSMRRGLGRYVRSGYGGSGTATKRFGGTAHTAGVLYGALSPAGREQASLPGGNLDAAVLSGRSANEVMNAVVEAIRPIDGTQDAEASRAAIKDALSELLTKFPDATLLELTEAQRIFAVERYVAHDVYRRFRLDVGKTIQDKALSVQAGLARLKEVKDYIKETVSRGIQEARGSGDVDNAQRYEARSVSTEGNLQRF